MYVPAALHGLGSTLNLTSGDEGCTFHPLAKQMPCLLLQEERLVCTYTTYIALEAYADDNLGSIYNLLRVPSRVWGHVLAYWPHCSRTMEWVSPRGVPRYNGQTTVQSMCGCFVEGEEQEGMSRNRGLIAQGEVAPRLADVGGKR